MPKAILAGTLTVAALAVILTMQGVSLHGMTGDDDEDEAPGNLRALFHLDKFRLLTSPVATLTPDSTGDGNTGNMIGAAAFVARGKFGPAVSFTGAGQVVEAGHDATMEPNFVTVEAWIKATASALGTDATILAYGADGCTQTATSGFASYSFNRNANDGLRFTISARGPAPALAPAVVHSAVLTAIDQLRNLAALPWAFHHVAGTFAPPVAPSTNRTVNLFVDGTQVGVGTPADGLKINYAQLPANRGLSLGRYDGANCSPAALPAFRSFNGTAASPSLLDEVRIWARALTGPEIAVSANMGTQTNVPVEIGGEAEDDGAQIVFTKEWEVTNTTPLTHTFNFDIVTAELSTQIKATPLTPRCTLGDAVVLKKAPPLGTVVTSSANALSGSGKSCTISVTRPTVTTSADVRFAVRLTNNGAVEGRIRIHQ